MNAPSSIASRARPARLGRRVSSSTPQRSSGYGSTHVEPGRRPTRRLAGLGQRAVVDQEHALGSLGDHVEAGVGRDRYQPRAQQAVVLEAQQAAPRAQQRVLERVLGVVHGAEHPVVGVELGVVRVEQALEGALVAVASGVEQIRLRAGARVEVGFIPHHVRPARAPELIGGQRLLARPVAVIRAGTWRRRDQSRRPPRAAHRQPSACVQLLHPLVRVARREGPRRLGVLSRARPRARGERRRGRARGRGVAVAALHRGGGPRRGDRAGAGAGGGRAGRSARGPGRVAQRARGARGLEIALWQPKRGAVTTGRGGRSLDELRRRIES